MDMDKPHNDAKRMVARWRINANEEWKRKAIDKFLTSGPIKPERFFYRLKRYCRMKTDKNTKSKSRQTSILNTEMRPN